MALPVPVEVVEIAVNLDDVSPEVVGHALGALLDEGALDAWAMPIGMKKNRPGVMLTLLCEAGDRDRLARRVIALTGSFGVRYRSWDRLVLQREHEMVATTLGPMRIKVGRLDGKAVTAKPEYDDVVALAARLGMALREVMDVGRAAAASLLADDAEKDGGA